MICSTLRWARQPSGVNVQSPAATCRMNPARTSSLWLTASASAGASRRVGRKSCEARAITCCRTRLLDRDQRGLGHGQGCRFGHLEAFWPVHAVGDPLVDLVEELLDEDVRRDLLEDAAVRVDESDVAPAGDAEVGVPRLPRTVHGAAEHRDLEVLWVAVQAFLDLLRERLDAHVVSPTARAG